MRCSLFLCWLLMRSLSFLLLLAASFTACAAAFVPPTATTTATPIIQRRSTTGALKEESLLIYSSSSLQQHSIISAAWGRTLLFLVAPSSSRTELNARRREEDDDDPSRSPIMTSTKSSSATTASSRSSTQQQSPTTRPHYRAIERMEKYARLPVWPVWSGVLLFLVEKVFGNAVAAALEHRFTGRVCPQIFVNQQTSTANSATSPFVLLVHHVHSFCLLDPIRWFQRQVILPEGFPAHPHRGFITYTYFLEKDGSGGGFVHRDSMGIRQVYGRQQQSAADHKSGAAQQQPHSQWLNTGAGLLHEEMFDFSSPRNKFWQRQELYQIWINVPGKYKMQLPSTMLLSDESEITDGVKGRSSSSGSSSSSQEDSDSSPLPQSMGTTPVLTTADMTVRVLAGSYQGLHASAPPPNLATNDDGLQLIMLHVMLHPQSKANSDSDEDNWMTIDLPASYETALMYMRQGQVECRQDGDETVLFPVHHTIFFSTQTRGEDSTICVRATDQNAAPSFLTGSLKADFLLLAAAPIKGEACAVGGSMVMTNAHEIDQAYRDYQAGLLGRPWDHALTDDEWRQHVKENPSAYTTTSRR